MSDFLKDIFNTLSGTEFEEIPVTPEEFVLGEDYCNIQEVSEHQMALVRAMSQIYKLETLVGLYGSEIAAQERFDETYREIIMQLGKGCHAPYTPVFNPETGNWCRLDSATIDGLVVSEDGKAHYATEAFPEGRGQMVRVKTALGFEEDVYIGHKYLSFTKSNFYRRRRGHSAEYTSVNELHVGDRIGVALGFDVDSPKNIPIEHAELIGYWLGDGMMPADHNVVLNMDFCSDERESIARYEELCAFIGDNPTKTVHPTKNLTFFRHGRNSNAVALAKEYGLWGMRSADKFVPSKVWASDNEVIRAVLSKLWQTDGCVYSKNGVTAEFVSVSKQLATDVQRMLLRVGVASNLRFRTPKSNFVNASEAGYVTVSSEECIEAFFNAVSLLDHKSVTPVKKSGRVYKRTINNIYYDRVVSIEPIGEGEYWTRTVPDTGNYVGNGMISANSGKDFTSTIGVAYVVYLLMCLKDPARYYDKVSGDSIDIINIAINSDQAKRVFFKNFVNRIKNNKWFEGKFTEKTDSIEFDKNITVYSGHSEREAFEGYNTLMVILDEISGFALESTSGHQSAKTAPAIYDMYKGSVTSRFAEFGKLVLLSFPRFENDFIQQKYDEVIAEKETITRTETLKIDPSQPDRIEGNEFQVSWEEDHILRYKFPFTFALKRPSWEVNPHKDLQTDYALDFYRNPGDALGRFACMPSGLDGGYFKRAEKIDLAFRTINGVDEDGVFHPQFTPRPDTQYFMHVDLAQKHDRCAVAMAHVDKWIEFRVGAHVEYLPVVVVDAVRWWTPSVDSSVDFKVVVEYIKSVRRRGFELKLVTFDRWNSHDTMQDLFRVGIETENLSVAKKHYDDFLITMYDERLVGPYVELLVTELKQLKLVKDKVDHPAKGYKDLSDAVCGAIYNAVAGTPMQENKEVEVYTLSDMKKIVRSIEEGVQENNDGVIRVPASTRGAPDAILDILKAAKIL